MNSVDKRLCASENEQCSQKIVCMLRRGLMLFLEGPEWDTATISLPTVPSISGIWFVRENKCFTHGYVMLIFTCVWFRVYRNLYFWTVWKCSTFVFVCVDGDESTVILENQANVTNLGMLPSSYGWMTFPVIRIPVDKIWEDKTPALMDNIPVDRIPKCRFGQNVERLA